MAGRFEVRIKILLSSVVGWNFMMLAALFVKPDPGAFADLVIVVDFHPNNGTEDREIEIESDFGND